VGIGAFEGLFSIWPIVAILGWGVGMFPPAILAYLTDISKKDTRGTTFGVYSVIFGSGMIIGPFVGAVFTELGNLTGQQVWGIVLAVLLLTTLSVIGTLFLKEKAIQEVSIAD
jgi:MFS family permease